MVASGPWGNGSPTGSGPVSPGSNPGGPAISGSRPCSPDVVPRSDRGGRPLRLEGKVAIVTGAGQTPGETIGNGRATALLLAREGSKVLLVDRDIDAARKTGKMIAAEGGEAAPSLADVTKSDDCSSMVDACVEQW